MKKKIFAVFAFVLVLSSVALNCFAQDTSSDDISSFYYSKIPLNLEFYIDGGSYWDSASIVVNSFGNSYQQSSLDFNYREIHEYSDFSYGISNNNGSFTDIKIPEEFTLEICRLFKDRFICQLVDSFWNTNQYRFYFDASLYEYYESQNIDMPYTVSFTILYLDENGNAQEYLYTNSSGIPFSSITQSMYVHGKEMYHYNLNLKQIMVNALNTLSSSIVGDYQFTDLNYIVVEDFVLDLNTRSLNIEYIRHLESSAPISNWQANAESNLTKGNIEAIADALRNPVENISLTNWLVNAIGGFMDFELVPGLSIGGMLGLCISIGLLIMFLKVFAGG